MDIERELHKIAEKNIHFDKTTREDLDVDYGILLPSHIAYLLFNKLEDQILYDLPDKTKVKIFGKWHKIPRQQAAYGDTGITYKYSGKKVPAKSWIPLLESVKNLLFKVTGHNFNFVLINRYTNGMDHIGEHRDNEKDLDPNSPIASLSLGQNRQFVFKHRDARKRGIDRRNIPPVKMLLKHGSLLMMNPPTNKIWYHSLPPRKHASGVRINLTFRCIKNNN